MYKLGRRAAVEHLGIKQAVEFTPEQADIYKWLAQQRGEYERAANAAGSVSPELQAQMLTNRNRMVAFADHKRNTDPHARLRLQHYPTPGEYMPGGVAMPKVPMQAPTMPAKPVAPVPRTMPTTSPAPASVKSWMGAARPIPSVSNAAANIASAVPTPTPGGLPLNKMRGILGALKR